MGVIAGFRWLEVFGTAVAAFGLLGDMVRIWKGKVSRRTESLMTVFEFVLSSGFFSLKIFTGWGRPITSKT